jgi:predicted GIY-YIG superfamily endonuclease
MVDKDLARLPSVSVDSLNWLPSVPAVYFAMNTEGPFYIGQTVNLYNRWHNHEGMPLFANKGVQEIRWIAVDNPSDRLALEKLLIKSYAPAMNIQFKGRFTPKPEPASTSKEKKLTVRDLEQAEKTLWWVSIIRDNGRERRQARMTSRKRSADDHYEFSDYYKDLYENLVD